jgi:hypothetical protein
MMQSADASLRLALQHYSPANEAMPQSEKRLKEHRPHIVTGLQPYRMQPLTAYHRRVTKIVSGLDSQHFDGRSF